MVPSELPGTDRAEGAPPHRGLTVGLILLITMVAFEALAVATVLPITVRELGHLSLYGWVFSAFMLANLVGTVWAGRESDRRGPGRALSVGLVLFAVGLVGGGLAPSMLALVVARTSQGAGAGVVVSVAYVIVGRSYPASARPRMLALMSSAWVVPSLIGPAVAAAAAQALSWRAVFVALVPGVAVVGGLTVPVVTRLDRSVRHPPPPAGDLAAKPVGGHRLVDAVRLAAGTGLLLAGLEAHGPAAAVGLVGGGLFVAVPGLRHLVPSGTATGRPGIPAAVLGRGLLTFAFFGAETFLPLALTEVRHEGPGTAGLALTGAALAWTAANWINARLAHHWGPRRCTFIGLSLVVVGVVAGGVGALEPAVPVWAVPPLWALAGAGMGLAHPSASLTVLADADAAAVGGAASSLLLSDVLGTALGAGVGGAAVAFSTAAGAGIRPGIVAVDVAAVAALALGLAVARGLPGPRPGGAGSTEPAAVAA